MPFHQDSAVKGASEPTKSSPPAVVAEPSATAATPEPKETKSDGSLAQGQYRF